MPAKLPRLGVVHDAPLPAHVRVAIVGAGFGGVGTGASAILLVPAIWPVVARLHLDATGRNSAPWPDTTGRDRRCVARFDAAAYMPSPRAAEAMAESVGAGGRA